MRHPKFHFCILMVFITILMDVLPFAGFISYNHIDITTMQIPVIITAIVLGPFYGLAIGTLFGLLSLFHAIARESTLMNIFFQNVLVSVVPRMCIGLVAGGLYLLLNRLFKGKCRIISTAVASFFGSLTNTFLVLFALVTLYPSGLVTHFRVTSMAQLNAILTEIMKTNGTIEAVLSTVVCTVLVMFLFWLQKRCRHRTVFSEV